MSDFKSRLKQEKVELDEKVSKLSGFKKSDSFNGINSVQRTLLNVQLKSMETYSECLSERLIWLDNTKNSESV